MLDENKNNEINDENNVEKKDKDNIEVEEAKIKSKEEKASERDQKVENKKQKNKQSKEQKIEIKERMIVIKQRNKEQKQLTKLNSKKILKGSIVSTQNYKPNLEENIIELVNVKKSYITGEVETIVLDNLNLKLKKGGFNVILGPSGSGKTTLLNLISGLDKANYGDVFVVGNNLSLLKDTDLTKFRREHIGFIFQQYNLLTNLTAKENAEVGENLSKNKKDRNWTIEKIFKTIDMEGQMNKYPHQMSGGQQQRVSIARALAKKPNILFGDEPTGALDEKTGRKVLDILININREFKTTVILVTHNPNIAEIADVVIHVLNGKIDQYITNDKPKKPSDISWT